MQIRNGFNNNPPNEVFKAVLEASDRKGVVTIDPLNNFMVNQGCLAISKGTLITGGLGPCVAVVIRQGHKHLLGHMDSYGFRSHEMSEIVDVIRQHFDPSEKGFELEIHNFSGREGMKKVVMTKTRELARLLGCDIKEGISFITPMHTLIVNELGQVTANLTEAHTRPMP